jgi:hypothetical protein
MKKLILILALLLISGVAVAGIFGGRSGVQTTPFLPSITAVSVTPNSFLGGSGDGTLVGAISVSASGATFAGTIAIGAGGQGGSFRLSSTTLPANLLLNGTQAAGTYTVNLVPTQAGLANSGNLFPVTITGTDVAAGCAQATTFLAGTSGLSQGQQDAYKAYICGLVADNVIPATASMASSGTTPYCGTKLDALWIMATANTTTANKDICGHTTYTLVPNGSPNFTANQGYLGVGGSSTVFLNTGFNPATAGGNFTQNSAHMAIWSLTNLAATSGNEGTAIGSYDNNLNISQILPWWIDGKGYGDVTANANTGQVGVAVSDSSGFYAISRTTSSLATFYKGGTSIGTNSTASQPMLSLPIYILGRNTNGSGDAGAGLRIAMASVGAGLLSGDVAAMQTRGCAYLTALNGTCAAPQSIASVAPSSCSFTPNVRNGVVCPLTVTMNPASPASTAALTLTGVNSGLFHLVGTGCSNISLGSCTIEQSSSANGTAAGTYTDVSVVATQAGINNSPFTQPLTLLGGPSQPLLGMYQGQGTSPAFHVWVGRYPDFVINLSYLGPGGGSDPSGNNPNPVILDFDTIGTSVCTSFATAASGGCDSLYRNTTENLILPYASNVYAIRIDSEWTQAGTNQSSPFDSSCNARVDPATWSAGVQHLVNVLRSYPALDSVKLQLDAPQDSRGVTYWPGDSYVELTGFDRYFFSQFDGSSANSWDMAINQTSPCGTNINTAAAFAAAHNKPMIIPEWCDTYTDGFITTNFATWMKTHNVVAQVYWDSNDNIGSPAGCRLLDYPARQTAYANAFGGTSYTGSYWTLKQPATGGY